jgi:hypothetical protein
MQAVIFRRVGDQVTAYAIKRVGPSRYHPGYSKQAGQPRREPGKPVKVQLGAKVPMGGPSGLYTGHCEWVAGQVAKHREQVKARQASRGAKAQPQAQNDNNTNKKAA